ncbi:b(0,+)-type amino acid transporter 1 [Galendromus occidentalis]|uniref:b(0,+)-type amino acid transporter 1 n=1 Tax=Galendromus occidentalis TaxID=34638 RepID=A0AAJ6QUT8_9ACAR|nr:b(0,+)-type amino acid transporter 1 [Galendromus occidentalis]
MDSDLRELLSSAPENAPRAPDTGRHKIFRKRKSLTSSRSAPKLSQASEISPLLQFVDSCPPINPSVYGPSSDSNGIRMSGTDPPTGTIRDTSGEDSTRLKRNLGLMSGVTLIVGTMIGSGIFVSPKGVLQNTGSVGLTLIVWAGCGMLSLFGALSFAELGTIINKSGGDYIYIYECFRGYRCGSVPAFLHSWTTVLLLKPASLGIMALSFAKYMVVPFFLSCDEIPSQPVKLLSLVCIALVTYINCASVHLASRIQTVFTIAKLGAIVAIVIGGFCWIAMGHTEYLETGFEGSTTSLGDVATAFYSGLWAYDGWNNLNYVTEELVNPYVNLPRAIWIAIPLVTVSYVLVNVAYLTVLSSSEFLASEAVAVRFGNYVFGPAAGLITLFVAASTFGSSNGSTFTAARISFTAAREGHLPSILSFAHATRVTPMPALLTNGILAAVLVLVSDIDKLIDLFGFAAWFFYGLATFTLIVFRFTRPDVPRPCKVNIIIPIVTCLVASYLVVGPIVQKPRPEYLYACAFVASGLIFYVPFVALGWRLRCTHGITRFLQCMLFVVPTAKPEEDSR